MSPREAGSARLPSFDGLICAPVKSADGTATPKDAMTKAKHLLIRATAIALIFGLPSLLARAELTKPVNARRPLLKFGDLPVEFAQNLGGLIDLFNKYLALRAKVP